VVVWLFSAAIVAGLYRSLLGWGVVAALALARAVLLRASHARLAVVLVLLCGCIGWASIERADSDRRAIARVAEAAHGNSVRLVGYVAGFPQSGPYGCSFPFATSLNGRDVRLWVRATCFDVSYGDSLAVDARIITTSRTPDELLTARGVAGEARARFEDVHRINGAHGCPLFRIVLWPMHRAARVRLARALGAEAPLAVGLLLGERGTLDRASYDAVRKLGITHLLALSGMHLTMIAALALLATRLAPRRRDLAVALALSLYVGVVGNVDSLTRAYAMALLILLARALVRPTRPVDALGKALFVMLLCAPRAILAVGLQLSFAATLAVFLCLERMPGVLLHPASATAPVWLRTLRRCGQGAAAAFLISLAVEAFIAPLQIHHFGRVSVVGPLATVLFLVPVSALQGLALAAAAGIPGLGEALAVALAWLSSATRDAIVAAGTMAPDPVVLPPPNWLLYYGGAWVACVAPRRRAAWVIAAGVIGLAFAVGS
jgi:ComEC/Rec2-related protein